MKIKYRTIKSEGRVILDCLLKDLGEEGWKLGGVAQSTEIVVGTNAVPGTATIHVYYYHFWKEVKP